MLVIAVNFNNKNHTKLQMLVIAGNFNDKNETKLQCRCSAGQRYKSFMILISFTTDSL